MHALSALSPTKAAELFCRCAPRRLTSAEFRDPRSEKKPIEFLAVHPLLEMLEGLPQAITLAAPLLQDRSLKEVHALLRKQGCAALEVADIVDRSRTSNDTLRASLSVSLKHLRTDMSNDDSVVEFFLIFGLLSGGLFDFDLEAIWANYVRYTRFYRDELVGSSRSVASPPRPQRAAWSKRTHGLTTKTKQIAKSRAISRLAHLWTTTSVVESDMGTAEQRNEDKNDPASSRDDTDHFWHAHVMRLMRASLIERTSVDTKRQRRGAHASLTRRSPHHYSTFSFFADYALRELENNFPARVRYCLERSCFRRLIEVVESVLDVFGRTSVEESEQLHLIWGKGYETNVWGMLRRASTMEDLAVDDPARKSEHSVASSSSSSTTTIVKQPVAHHHKKITHALKFLKSLRKPPESVIKIVRLCTK